MGQLKKYNKKCKLGVDKSKTTDYNEITEKEQMFGKEKIMTNSMFLQTMCEAIAIGFVVWGLFNEGKLVAFEKRLKCYFNRRRLKIRNSENKFSKHCA